MTRYYLGLAIGALGFAAAMTFIKHSEQMWANLYILTICLVGGALVTAVKRFEPNRWLAFVLMTLVCGVGAVAVASQMVAAP